MKHRAVAAIAMAGLTLTATGFGDRASGSGAPAMPTSAVEADRSAGASKPSAKEPVAASAKAPEPRAHPDASAPEPEGPGSGGSAQPFAAPDDPPGELAGETGQPATTNGVMFGGGTTVIAPDPFVGLYADNPDSVIGTIDTHQLAPEGIGLVGPVQAGDGTAVGFGAPTGLSGGYGCAIQCIEEGLAYARGFGAELVVETSVPTTMFFGVIELTPGLPPVATTTINSMDTYHSWALDELDPAKTYGVTVLATDTDGNSDLGYGEFTTLSTRSVSIEVGDVSITGGPSNIDYTHLYVGLSGEDLVEVTPGQGGTPVFDDVTRYADVSLLVRRKIDIGGCAAFPGVGGPYEVPDQGHSIDACMVWNTARVNDVDLDVAPAGATRWNQTSFTRQLQTPNGAGEALPAGFGDDWWLYVDSTATFHVTYS